MRIICKEKDYYDYIGYTNETEDITFDRRKMTVYKRGTIPFDYNSIGYFVSSVIGNSDVGYLFLWIGYRIYAFKITSIKNRYEYSAGVRMVSSKFTYKVELVDKRICYDVKHRFPIEFMIRNHKNWWHKEYEKEIKESSVSNWDLQEFYNNPFEEDYKIPILKETFIPSFVPANEAYYAIEEWLISQHNDVTQESRGIMDIDKVINHGFDKRTSFRNMK